MKLSEINSKMEVLRNIIETNQAALNSLARMKEDLKREARKELPTPKYEFQVFPYDARFNSCGRMPEDADAIRLSATLMNKEVFDNFEKEYGSMINPPEDMRTSVVYFRINQVLCYDHGGWIVLPPYQIIPDEDWEKIKANDQETIKKYVG